MQRSRETLEAAAERCKCIADGTLDPPERFDMTLAATILRETAKGMDGFESIEKRTRETLSFLAPDVIEKSVEWARVCYLAGRASASAEIDELENDKCVIAAKYEKSQQQIASLQADVDALADEVERLTCGMPSFILDDRPQRVRDILDARRKEYRL